MTTPNPSDLYLLALRDLADAAAQLSRQARIAAHAADPATGRVPARRAHSLANSVFHLLACTGDIDPVAAELVAHEASQVFGDRFDSYPVPVVGEISDDGRVTHYASAAAR